MCQSNWDCSEGLCLSWICVCAALCGRLTAGLHTHQKQGGHWGFVLPAWTAPLLFYKKRQSLPCSALCLTKSGSWLIIHISAWTPIVYFLSSY